MRDHTVVVAAADVLVAELLSSVLADGRLRVEATVTSPEALLAAVARVNPVLVVATTTVGPHELAGLLPTLLAAGTRVLAIATDASVEPAALLLGGASGYLAIHDLGTDELVGAARSVAAGEAALHPAAAEVVLRLWRGGGRPGEPARASATLTTREAELLRSMVDGLSNKAAAQRLGVSLKTIESHKSRIFTKLGVRTQAQAVAAALLGEPAVEGARIGPDAVAPGPEA